MNVRKKIKIKLNGKKIQVFKDSSLISVLKKFKIPNIGYFNEIR